MLLSLGIDIGTTGVKTATINSDGEVLSISNIKHKIQNSDKIDPSIWWKTVKIAIRSNLIGLNNNGINSFKIKKLAVDGTSGTVLLANEYLQPVTRALMYNSSGFVEEAKIIEKYSPEKHIAKGQNSTLARALKLIKEDKNRKAKYLMHQADFIVANLLKKGGLSDHNNTLKLGYDIKKNSWPEWIIKTGLKKYLLPKVYPVGTQLGKLNDSVANELGLDRNTNIYAGTTDSNAGFLSCATFKKGSAVTSLGSTLTVKILSENQIEDSNIGLYSHKLGNYWLVGGASNTGGNVLEKYFTVNEIINLSKDINPNNISGLEYYPLTKVGERFPKNDPKLKPCLTPRPKNEALFLHGLFEGMAKIEKKSYDAISQLGGFFPNHIFTVGGGSTNMVWEKIRIKIIKTKISPGKNVEAAVGTAKIPFLFCNKNLT
ncbi:MAG: FGGY-family carbohydrate kinase [Paracoccaceae bacterium]